MRSTGYISSVFRVWHYLLLALVLLVPTLILFSYFSHIDFSLLTYARLGLLSSTVTNTLIHLALAIFGSLIIGVPLAWLSSIYRSSAMESFWWALLLPMAMPTFALASIYEEYGIFDDIALVYRMAIYSSLSLYPLVYLVMRIAFSTQNSEYIDGSRCLGTGAFSGLFRVGISMNRPALVAAVLLVSMDLLSDVATPQMLGFHSIAHTIFQASNEDQVRPLAIELVSLLMVLFLLLLWLEDATRGNKRYHQIISGFHPGRRVPLSIAGSWLLAMASLAVLVASLFYPMMGLVTVSPDVPQTSLSELAQPALTSFLMALITSLTVILLALIICFGLRYNPTLPLKLVSWLPSLSLVIPGSILALLVLSPMEQLDEFFGRFLQAIYNEPIEQPLLSTMVPVIYMLVIKFLAVGTFAIRAATVTTSVTMDQASRSLGSSSVATFVRIHLPFLLPTLAAVLFLVFAETIKEAAIVLILLPETEQTLVSHAFNSIADKGIFSSSREIVLIIAITLIPALLLTAIINLKKI